MGDSMNKVVMLLLLCAVVILAACTQSGESEETDDSALAGNAVNKGANLCNAKNEGKVLKDCPNNENVKSVCQSGKAFPLLFLLMNWRTPEPGRACSLH